MEVKTHSIRFLVSIILLLFLNNFTLAQNTDSIKINLPTAESPADFNPISLTQIMENSKPDRINLFTPTDILQKRITAINWILSKPKPADPKVTVEQNNIKNNLPNLGESNEFSGNINYPVADEINVNVGMGLYQQNTVLTPRNINYQLGLTADAEYALTSWLSAYIYGQYISPSLNHSDFFDPLQFMNPLFKHTELGGGLRAQHKGLKADVGMRNIRGSDPEKNKFSTNYFQTKVSFGF